MQNQSMPASRSNLLPLTFRPAYEEDLNLVFSSWMQSVAFVDRFGKRQGIDHETYKRGHRDLIVKILQSSTITVAANPEDLWQVLGYVVAQVDKELDSVTFHYCYVKGPYRGNGIATRLLEGFPAGMKKFHTYRNAFAGHFAVKYYSVYNPYLIWR